MYFIWRNNPRGVLGHALNWIPGPEITKRLEEVGCFASADVARSYIRMHFPASNVVVLNHKIFQQKIKSKKLPQFKAIQPDTADGNLSENDHLIYAEYLEKLVGKAVPGENTIMFPSANTIETSGTELIVSIKRLLEMIISGRESLFEKEMDLKDKIRQLDLITSDRLHQAELCKLSDAEAFPYVSALKENLILRRRYKNELLAVQSAKEALGGVDNTAIKGSLQRIEGIGKQSYHCRVLTEKDTIVEAIKMQRKE